MMYIKKTCAAFIFMHMQTIHTMDGQNSSSSSAHVVINTNDYSDDEEENQPGSRRISDSSSHSPVVAPNSLIQLSTSNNYIPFDQQPRIPTHSSGHSVELASIAAGKVLVRAISEPISNFCVNNSPNNQHLLQRSVSEQPPHICLHPLCKHTDSQEPQPYQN